MVLLSAELYGSPLSFSYGGRLTSADGTPVQGSVNIEVKLYKASNGGSPISISIPAFNDVALIDGVFQLEITLTGSDANAAFGGSGSVWIEVTDTTNGRTYPRQSFTASCRISKEFHRLGR